MATMRIGGLTALAPAVEADSGRRRAARYPTGWLMVEAETGGDGRKLGGRLLDTSAGGLGLVLDEELTAGTIVRVSLASTHQPDVRAFWQNRHARVAYAVPLPGGSWRVGLTFIHDSLGGSEIWATRLLLLAVFLIATASALYSEPAGFLAGAVLGAVAIVLAIGAEREHRVGGRDTCYGAPKARANR